MIRLRLLALAAVFLVVSALLAPAPSRAEVSLTTAVGKSMGGLRVLLVDVLFIRADALVTAGRAEDLAEAQELYETILLLDPANDTAHAFLVDMLVLQMLPLGTTTEARFGWWKEGWDLAQRGLELNPASAMLHYRTADLLIAVGVSDIEYVKELLPRVEALVPDRRARILDHLLRAARLRENLPTRGFTHLSQLSVHAPLIAAEAAREGDEALYARAVHAGEELLRLRGPRLQEIFVPVTHLDGSQGEPIHRASLLRGGLNAVQGIRDALAADRPERAQRVVEAYAEVIGQSRMLLALRRLAASR